MINLQKRINTFLKYFHRGWRIGILFLGFLGASQTIFAYDLQITEIWPRYTDHYLDGVERSWFEITNVGTTPWIRGYHDDLWSQDFPTDPTLSSSLVAYRIVGINEILPGESVVVIDVNSSTYRDQVDNPDLCGITSSERTDFLHVWGSFGLIDRVCDFKIGYVRSNFLSTNGDKLILFEGYSNRTYSGESPDNLLPIDCVEYPSTIGNDGKSYDVELSDFSTVGSSYGAFVGTNTSRSVIGSPGEYNHLGTSSCPDFSSITEEDLQVRITNSTCTEFGATPSGGSLNRPIINCPAGSSLFYEVDGRIQLTTLPLYNQTTSETITAFCSCEGNRSVVGSVTTAVGSCPICPDFSGLTEASLQLGITNSICTAFGSSPTGGILTAPTGSCPTGSTLWYVVDGGTPTATLPSYNQTTSETITAYCSCEADDTEISVVGSVSTQAGSCPICPDFSGLTEASLQLGITNSICTAFGSSPTGGILTAPTGSCPTGSTLWYVVDGGTPTITLPSYNQTTNQTITAFCSCDSDATETSVVGSVKTESGNCPEAARFTSMSLVVNNPCNCDNPANIINSLGLVALFQDKLEVTTTPDVRVTLSANDGNLLDSNGVPLPVGTPIPQTSPGSGEYVLVFYSRPEQSATITISNGADTEVYITASGMICPSVIPTLSEWGLMIFGLLILNLGLIFLRKKQELISVIHENK